MKIYNFPGELSGVLSLKLDKIEGWRSLVPLGEPVSVPLSLRDRDRVAQVQLFPTDRLTV